MAAEVTLDRFGRILVPKALRDRYGWNPGISLRLMEDGDGIRVMPAAAPTGAGVTVADGRVVFDAVWHGPQTGPRDPAVAWNPPSFDADRAPGAGDPS